MLRVVTVPKAALFPVVLVLCTIGAYALNNTMSNVYILLASAFWLCDGQVRAFRSRLHPRRGPRRSDRDQPDPRHHDGSESWLFLTRPISGAMIALSVASLAFSIWQHYRHRAKVAARSKRTSSAPCLESGGTPSPA